MKTSKFLQASCICVALFFGCAQATTSPRWRQYFLHLHPDSRNRHQRLDDPGRGADGHDGRGDGHNRDGEYWLCFFRLDGQPRGERELRQRRERLDDSHPHRERHDNAYICQYVFCDVLPNGATGGRSRPTASSTRRALSSCSRQQRQPHKCRIRFCRLDNQCHRARSQLCGRNQFSARDGQRLPLRRLDPQYPYIYQLRNEHHYYRVFHRSERAPCHSRWSYRNRGVRLQR